MMPSQTCPLCNLPARAVLHEDACHFVCFKCGRYRCIPSFEVMVAFRPLEERAALSIYTRSSLTTEILSPENIDGFIEAIKALSIESSLEMALSNLCKEAGQAGGEVELSFQNDPPLCCAITEKQMDEFVRSLEEQKLLRILARTKEGLLISPTVRAFAQVEEYRRMQEEASHRGPLGFKPRDRDKPSKSE